MLPNNYNLGGGSAVASYSYSEVANAQGYVTFYAHASTSTLTGSSIQYHLSETTRYSSPNELTSASTTNQVTPQLVSTYNFDTTAFNAPRIIEDGTAFITMQYADNGAGDMHPVVSITHLEGTTETTIGSVTGMSSNNTYLPTGFAVFPVTTTRKKFKVGDKLRLKVAVYCISSAGGATTGLFPINPINTATTTFAPTNYPTYLKLDIPFKINL